MATISISIKKGEKKNDGTWRVKFRLTHKGKVTYINTDTYVDKTQLTRSLEIKDNDVFVELSDKLKDYRKKISSLSELEMYSLQELKDHLVKKETKASNIDFIKVLDTLVMERMEIGKTGSIDNFKGIRSSLIDFYGYERIPITEITSSKMFEYEKYLMSERTIVRNDQFSRPLKRKVKALSRNGVIRQMALIRIVFNEARRKYNNPDTGNIVIAHYPFITYKIGRPSKSRHRTVSEDVLYDIINFKAKRGSRAEIGRDMFLLSFYLCGMNSGDIYELPIYKGEERIEYNRKKTKDRRTDGAFISIKVPKIAVPLLRKYAGKLKSAYSDRKNLTRAINTGLSVIHDGVTHYYARHTFATMARKAGCSIDDIAMAMNHVDQKNKVTGIYIEPDWTIIDRVQEKVLGLLDFEIKTIE